MTKQTKRQPVSRIPDHFPCPGCQRMVNVGEKFCGFCEKPLLVQCPTCGDWTKANHRVCPQCASPLHEGGRTFAENHKLARLQGDLRELIAEHAATEQRLDSLLNERNHAAIRLLVVMLVSVLLFALGAPVVAFLNALGVWGVIVVIVALVTFGAVALVIVSAYVRLCRWGSITVVIEIQKEISQERASLKDLEAERAELEEAIAYLQSKGTRPTRRYADWRPFGEEEEDGCRDLKDLQEWMSREEEKQNTSATGEEEPQSIGRPNGSAEIQPPPEASPAQPVSASDKDAGPDAQGEEDVIEAEVVELRAEKVEEDEGVEERLEEVGVVAQNKATLKPAVHRWEREEQKEREAEERASLNN